MTTGTLQLKEFFARQGSRFTDADARIIGTELERIGPATADDIVNAARSEDAPLHRYFEWDDHVAAEEFRRGQARVMAASIVVKVVGSDQKEHEVRAFHPVQFQISSPEKHAEREPKAYVPISLLEGDSKQAQQIIDEAKRHLISWKETYQKYRAVFPSFESQFRPLFKSLEEVVETGV